MNKIAVVGANGLVGEEFIKIFQEKRNDFEILKFRRSRNDADGELSLTQDSEKLESCKFIFNAASAEAAKQIVQKLKPTQYLIDNSSAFRMNRDVPLIVPEVNRQSLGNQNIIANPNCTAGILCVALNPLKKFGIKQIIISTYQAASGAGKEGLAELKAQMTGAANTSTAIFGFPLAGNVVSHNSQVRLEGVGEGFNDEEFKVIEETRKILDQPTLPISVTCIRVPVERAHTESVVVDLDRNVSIEELWKLYADQPGLKLVDDREKNYFPMPLEAQRKREVLVGRFRKDLTVANRILFMVAGDQLLKGAAWNAYQIFEILERKSAG